jgi:hypothetical protein
MPDGTSTISVIWPTITTTSKLKRRRNSAIAKDATSSNAVDSVKDATTDRDKAMKAITLITIKATPTVVQVEMTIATPKATVTSSKAPRTDMETVIGTTTTATDRTTDRVNRTEMDRADTIHDTRNASINSRMAENHHIDNDNSNSKDDRSESEETYHSETDYERDSKSVEDNEIYFTEKDFQPPAGINYDKVQSNNSEEYETDNNSIPPFRKNHQI